MQRLSQFAATAALALVALPITAAAQDVRVREAPLERSRILIDRLGDGPMIGVTTTQESARSDTLGLLIDDVRRDSPAAKAGRSRTVRVTLMKSSELPGNDFEFAAPGGFIFRSPSPDAPPFFVAVPQETRTQCRAASR